MFNFDFLKLRKSVAEVGDAMASIKSEIQKLKAERDTLENAPLSQAELVHMVGDFIDKQGRLFPKHLAESLARFKFRPAGKLRAQLCANSICFRNPTQSLRLLNAAPAGVGPDVNETLSVCMFFIFGDQLKAGMAKAINEAWPETTTLTIEERERKIKKLTDDIEALEARRDELKAIANEIGTGLVGQGRHELKGRTAPGNKIAGPGTKATRPIR